MRGIIRVGPLRSPRSEWQAYDNPDLAEVLRTTPAAPDWMIEADERAELSFLDLDTHHFRQLPDVAALNAYAAALHPESDAWWVTHGHGLRGVYTGPHHADRALAAAFSAPAAFHVELLRHSRHPLSVRTDRPDARCGAVNYPDTDPSQPFKFRAVGTLTPELRSQALVQLEMELGARYDHDRCPIDPGADSDARDCIVVLNAGVYCHRCASHGVRYAPRLRPGWRPFSSWVGHDTSVLDALSAERVHWTHARLVLRHHHPSLGESLLRTAYRRTLEHAYGETDPRLGMVFSENLDFVRGDELWFDTQKFAPTIVDNDAANALPYCMYVDADDDGKPITRVDGARRAQVKHRSPRGYTPVRPYRGITFRDDAGATIPVQIAPHPRHPIRLLDDPMPLDAAFAELECAFPRLNREYFMGCLAAGICAEAGSGQPPMLCATGPSGSGKGETIRLAASFLGEIAVKIQLCGNPEEFARNAGMILAAGHRFVVFDELGKTPALHKKLGPLLQLGAGVDWRPLFQNVRVHTTCRAAFFYPCVRFPKFLTSSPEFLRRTRAVHLHRLTPKWNETSGGDTASWRDRNEASAHIANSMLTHTWRICHAYQFRFL